MHTHAPTCTAHALHMYPYAHAVEQVFVAFSIAGMLSPTAACHAWDKSGDGFARGELCSAILMGPAPLSGAGSMGVISLIGTSLRQDGKSASLTVSTCTCSHAHATSTYRCAHAHMLSCSCGFNLQAPSGPGQREMFATAWADGAADPRQAVTYESHGTGTALGDPIEMGSVAGVLLAGRTAESIGLQVSGVKASVVMNYLVVINIIK